MQKAHAETTACAKDSEIGYDSAYKNRLISLEARNGTTGKPWISFPPMENGEASERLLGTASRVRHSSDTLAARGGKHLEELGADGGYIACAHGDDEIVIHTVIRKIIFNFREG